jgi:hypothetical protein
MDRALKRPAERRGARSMVVRRADIVRNCNLVVEVW